MLDSSRYSILYCHIMSRLFTGLLSLPFLTAALADESPLASALTIYASFDKGVDADHAKGDPKLYTWVNRGKNVSKEGLHTGNKSEIAKGRGKFGDAMAFRSGDAPWIYYAADGNLCYQKVNCSGTSSFWLQCDPVDGLAKGYSDPVQFTPRAWNDASFFVDFNKEGKPRDFRLGCFADKKVWNPGGGEVPETERPLLTSKNPGFAPGKWVHVLFTWENFNSGKKDAVAKLYLNGTLNGTLDGWNQQFTWKPTETARLLLGLNYIGLMDDFACFNRTLTAEEVKQIYLMKDGLGALLGGDS